MSIKQSVEQGNVIVFLIFIYFLISEISSESDPCSEVFEFKAQENAWLSNF